MARDKGGFDAERLGEMLADCLMSFNECDGNGDPANVVDGLHFAGRVVADAIAPRGAAPGTDASGGRVGSLTEAVMGITAGLFRLAEAIDGLAESNRSNQS